MFSSYTVIVKGGGDLATAVAHKLFRAGFPVIITELDKPMMVRRNVSFANCVYERQWTVEGITSVLVDDEKEIGNIINEGKIPLIVDPQCHIRFKVKPAIIVDGILAKKNCGTYLKDAPIVIALGPGFNSGEDVHLVVETQRGHNLGKIIFSGGAEPDTGIPGEVKGYTSERILRAPKSGLVKNHMHIGSIVEKGDIICYVDENPIISQISGIVRGLIHEGAKVNKYEKIGHIDPRGIEEYCNTISEKGRNIAGGVLEGILILIKEKYKYFGEY
jgi:xanthine dehydrogenase accessory factor